MESRSYSQFPAVELLLEENRVVGARIGDKGRDSKGTPKSNFEPGIDVMARITVLGEGPRGTLARQAEERLGLRRDSGPQLYSLGVKEVWKVPDIELVWNRLPHFGVSYGHQRIWRWFHLHVSRGTSPCGICRWAGF